MPAMHHTVLVVDDDKLILNTLKKQFETWNINVIAVSSPEEAKQAMQNQQPELVVLDMLLNPAEGASDILDYMKTRPALQHVPVVALTNLDDLELKERLLAEGQVKEYLIKGSLDLEALHKKMWSYLEPSGNI